MNNIKEKLNEVASLLQQENDKIKSLKKDMKSTDIPKSLIAANKINQTKKDFLEIQEKMDKINSLINTYINVNDHQFGE